MRVPETHFKSRSSASFEKKEVTQRVLYLTCPSDMACLCKLQNPRTGTIQVYWLMGGVVHEKGMIIDVAAERPIFGGGWGWGIFICRSKGLKIINFCFSFTTYLIACIWTIRTSPDMYCFEIVDESVGWVLAEGEGAKLGTCWWEF